MCFEVGACGLWCGRSVRQVLPVPQTAVLRAATHVVLRPHAFDLRMTCVDSQQHTGDYLALGPRLSHLCAGTYDVFVLLAFIHITPPTKHCQPVLEGCHA